MRIDLLHEPDESIIASLENSKGYCAVSDQWIYIGGRYFIFQGHLMKRREGDLSIPLKDVKRVGITTTYSRLMFLFPMVFGFSALIIKAIPSIGISFWKGFFSLTLWSVPYQDFLWQLCCILCLLTIPMYWLSYRKRLEINTVEGRFYLSRRGLDIKAVDTFGKRVSALKTYKSNH